MHTSQIYHLTLGVIIVLVAALMIAKSWGRKINRQNYGQAYRKKNRKR